MSRPEPQPRPSIAGFAEGNAEHGEEVASIDRAIRIDCWIEREATFA